MEFLEFEGKTTEEAIESACAHFQVPSEGLEIEIVSVGSPGIFGLGGRKARIRAARSQGRGTAICAAVIRGLPVYEYTALQVKQAVVGNGHAAKEQVQEMVKRLLRLGGDPNPDAADALACAICHAHGGQGLGKLATAGYRMKRGRLV